MSQSDNDVGAILKKITEKLDKVEQRVKRLEFFVDSGEFETEQLQTAPEAPVSVKNESVESRVGEYGLAWLGTIVLFLSISSLMAYLYNNGYIVFSSILGYSLSVFVFVAVKYLRRTAPYLVLLLTLIGHILIYYTTLRLHYFSAQPLVSSMFITLILLAGALGAQLYFSVHKKSELLAGLTILLFLTTAIISNSSHIYLSIISLTAAIALYLFVAHTWWRLLLFTIILVYSSHLIWLFNNPIMGNPFQPMTAHQYNHIYLALYGVLFSLPLLVPRKERFSRAIFPAIFLLNGFVFFVLCAFVILMFFQEQYSEISLAISVFCISFSILLKKKTDLHFAPSFYACFGFMALSLALKSLAGLPDVYPLLMLQSLLVVSMALWFRSRIIVVVNSFLFLFILLAYLLSSPSANFTNFTIVFTALATARIMNWQKERLTLQTEMMRNINLVSAFFMLLFSLHHAAPSQHVTLAWAGAASLYFIMSIWLKNEKYRWMAILTLVAACIYLFTKGLAIMGVGYSIVAFLAIAIISISASLFYTNQKKKLNTGNQ